MKSMARPALISAFLICAALCSPADEALNAPAGTPGVPPKPWSGTFDVSASLNGGNTDTSVLALRLKADRKSTAANMLIEASYDYGEESGVNNIRKAFLRDRIEWTPNVVFPWAEAKGEHDLFGGIDLRLTLAAGAGVHIIKKEEKALSFRLGAGYVSENAVLPADNKERLLITAGLDFRQRFAPSTALEFNLLWENELGPWRLKSELTLRHSLSNHLSFRIGATDAYDSHPPTGKLGNDFSILAGLGYVF